MKTPNADDACCSSASMALYRETMGRLAGGISVILSGTASTPKGMTVNSLVSVSLDPLLLLFCARRKSVTAMTVIETGVFSVNILSEQQLSASRFFSGYCGAPSSCEIAGVRDHIWIKETVGSFLCSVETAHRAGDHDIIIGRVRDIIDNPSRPSPLIYHEGRYRSLGPVCTEPDHARLPARSPFAVGAA
jgi:3-hydroxy-9,10-secoandrosta-1,3,5(10)-triene-9,17-dione monooxygenase reductase component